MIGVNLHPRRSDEKQISAHVIAVQNSFRSHKESTDRNDLTQLNG